MSTPLGPNICSRSRLAIVVSLVAVQGDVIAIEFALAGISHVAEESTVEGVIIAISERVLVSRQRGDTLEILKSSVNIPCELVSGPSSTYIMIIETKLVTKQITSRRRSYWHHSQLRACR